MSAGLLPEVGLVSAPHHSRVPVGPGAVASGLSVALPAVAAATCALILLVPDVLTGTAVMNGSARGTAAVALVVGVPALTAAMVLARRGWARAVPVWLGTVAYLLSNAALLVFATPFDHLFLLYLLMLSMALWTLVTVPLGLTGPFRGRRRQPRQCVQALGRPAWFADGWVSNSWGVRARVREPCRSCSLATRLRPRRLGAARDCDVAVWGGGC
jgi:hypothetical protein